MKRLTMHDTLDYENILYSPKDEKEIVKKLAEYEDLEERLEKEFGTNVSAFELIDLYLKHIEKVDGEVLKGFRILTNKDALLYDEWKKSVSSK